MTRSTQSSKPKIKYRLVPVHGSKKYPAAPILQPLNHDSTNLLSTDSIFMSTYNVHTNGSVTGDCICIYCSFRFTPRRSTAARFASPHYSGLDCCPMCYGQGGIIRTHLIDLTKLSDIRTALIDLITTQNRKSYWCSESTNEIHPIWSKIEQSRIAAEQKSVRIVSPTHSITI